MAQNLNIFSYYPIKLIKSSQLRNYWNSFRKFGKLSEKLFQLLQIQTAFIISLATKKPAATKK